MKCRLSYCCKPVRYNKLCNKHAEWQRRHPKQPIVYNEQTHEKHGMSKHPVYRTWVDMIRRCYDKNSPVYEHYGGRGITVCDEWKDSFLTFYSDIGKRPKALTLDRINNDGDYEPSNCRWATQKEQIINRRISKNNKTGITGVSFYNGKYHAELYRDGKKIFRNSFETLEDAVEARRGAEQAYIKSSTSR